MTLKSKTAVINEITAHDIALGSLCTEAESSHSSENNMAALACLFILIESALKRGLDEEDGQGLKKVIDRALLEGLIDKDESLILHRIREIRNMFFHGNHYEHVLEINNLLYPIYEGDTKQVIYETYSEFAFRIAEKIINKSLNEL